MHSPNPRIRKEAAEVLVSRKPVKTGSLARLRLAGVFSYAILKIPFVESAVGGTMESVPLVTV